MSCTLTSHLFPVISDKINPKQIKIANSRSWYTHGNLMISKKAILSPFKCYKGSRGVSDKCSTYINLFFFYSDNKYKTPFKHFCFKATKLFQVKLNYDIHCNGPSAGLGNSWSGTKHGKLLLLWETDPYDLPKMFVHYVYITDQRTTLRGKKKIWIGQFLLRNL